MTFETEPRPGTRMVRVAAEQSPPSLHRGAAHDVQLRHKSGGARRPLASAIGLCAHTARSCVVGAPIAAERRRHTYDLAGRGCVYLQAVADVDTDMAYPGLVRVGEEDEVTWVWIANRHRGVELINGNAGYTDAGRRIHVLDEAAAIDAGA